MARAPKIPGLRSWKKIGGRKGYRSVWEYSADALQASGRVIHLFPVPGKVADGPIRAYYAIVGSLGETKKLPTKTDVIKAVRAMLREHWSARANPLSKREIKQVRGMQRALRGEAMHTSRRAAREIISGNRHEARFLERESVHTAGRADGLEDAVRAFPWRRNPVVAAPRSVRGNPAPGKPSRSYIAHVFATGPHATVRPLLGGVFNYFSSRFSTRADAEKLGAEMVESNRLAGRPATYKIQTSTQHPEISPASQPEAPRRNPGRRSATASTKTRAPKRRNPTSTLCRHTLPLAKGGHGRVTVCYPQGVFPNLKAAVVNIQRELRAKFGRLKAAPVVRTATWAYSDAGRTRGRWTFTG